MEVIAAQPVEELLHELRVHQIELEVQNETLRQAQAALEESRDRYLDLYEFAPVGYLTIGADGVIMEINLTGTRLLGGDRKHLLRRRFSSYVVPEDRDRWVRHLMRVARDDVQGSAELLLQRDDGTHFHAQIDSTQALARNAGPVEQGGVRIALRDISSRKLAEAERTRLAAVLNDKNIELEHARASAEKASLAKSDFLSSMSHELRTPLNAILGFAQLMESGVAPLTSSQKGSVDQILKAGWYLLELVNEILDLAAIESGKTSLVMESVELGAVMRDCHAMIKPLAQSHGIAVNFPHLENSHLVRSDRTRLKQVLINLLSNAVKYNKSGGTVTVDCGPGQPGMLRINVRDTGAGLAPRQLAQLFQPFNRLGLKAGVGEEGTGIGLVVCKRLVELMAGSIGVDSTVGKGSVFWFELRLVAGP